MKKLTSALLATAVLSSGASATEVGFYAGGGVAFEAVPNNSQDWEMGLGVVLRGGMTLDTVLEGFGAEVELTKSVVDPKAYIGNASRDKINVTTLATYAVYRIPVTNQIYVKPRFGIIFPNLGGEDYVGSNDAVVNSRDVTFSSGIGGGFTVMDHLDVYVDYTVLGESITNYGAGVEFHF